MLRQERTDPAPAAREQPLLPVGRSRSEPSRAQLDPLGPGRGEVAGEVEHHRPAEAAVREQEIALARLELPLAAHRPQAGGQGDAREPGPGTLRGEERHQRRVGGLDPVAEPARQLEPPPVAPGPRGRQPAGRQHQPPAAQALAASARELEARAALAIDRQQALDAEAAADPRARAIGRRQEGHEHLRRAPARREHLAAGLLGQGDAQLPLEEGGELTQGPGVQQASQDPGVGPRVEVVQAQPRGQEVAAAAAADADLGSRPRSGLQDQGGASGARREEARHQAGGPRSDDDGGPDPCLGDGLADTLHSQASA